MSLHVTAGERFGLIGPNGSGKTTLINCVSGALPTDGGRILFEGRDITALPAYRRTRLGIVRSFQIPKPFTSMTVLESTARRGGDAREDELPLPAVRGRAGSCVA